MTSICGEVLFYQGEPAGICTAPWGTEHSHSDCEPLVRVYEPDREPDDITIFDALVMLRANTIYRYHDGQFWLRPGLVWEDVKP